MTDHVNSYGATYDAATGQGGEMKIKPGALKLHLAKAPEYTEPVLEDGTVEVNAEMEVEAVTMPATYLREIARRIVNLETQLAEAQQREALLRDATLTLWESYGLLCDYAEGLPNKVFIGAISGFFIDATEKMQAAIDGGAMEGE